MTWYSQCEICGEQTVPQTYRCENHQGSNMTEDEAINKMVRIVMNDQDLQSHVHTQAVMTLGLDSSFGSNDDDEDHPQYDRYWEVVTATWMHLLGAISSKIAPIRPI